MDLSLALQYAIIAIAVVAHVLIIGLLSVQWTAGERRFDNPPMEVDLIAETEERFGIAIKRFYPKPDDIDAYAAKYGLNGFYESVEARHACCHVRKLVPLAEALSGARFWITGLRRSQSGNRAATPFAEYDAERDLIKVNPEDIPKLPKTSHAFWYEDPWVSGDLLGLMLLKAAPSQRGLEAQSGPRAARYWTFPPDFKDRVQRLFTPAAAASSPVSGFRSTAWSPRAAAPSTRPR